MKCDKSDRQHRRRRLIVYRPSPENSLNSPVAVQSVEFLSQSSHGDPDAGQREHKRRCKVDVSSSPLETEGKKTFSEGFKELDAPCGKAHPNERTPLREEWTPCSGLDQEEGTDNFGEGTNNPSYSPIISTPLSPISHSPPYPCASLHSSLNSPHLTPPPSLASPHLAPPPSLASPHLTLSSSLASPHLTLSSSLASPHLTSPPSRASPHLTPPPLTPPKFQSWSLVPLLHNVRSKLESFAEIFFTPMKGFRDPGREGQRRPEEEGRGEKHEEIKEDTPRSQRGGDLSEGAEMNPGGVCRSSPATDLGDDPGSKYASSHSLMFPSPETGGGAQYTGAPQEEDAGGRAEEVTGTCSEEMCPPSSPGPSGEGTIQLKTTASNSVHAMCRPPLLRCLSCPSLPPTQSSYPRDRSNSLGTLEEWKVLASPHPYKAASTLCRRHSLGSLGESRELSIFSLTCLRKEKHPDLLCPPTSRWHPQGHTRTLHHMEGSVHNEGSPHSPVMCDNGVNKPFLSSQTSSTVEIHIEDASESVRKESGSWKCLPAGKVSNFQIRKRPLRQHGNLTPLGLPKRVRLQKEEFSLEEIYTNKNYHTPTEKRTFETIFEEPLVKRGNLVLTSQRPLRRLIVFRDSSVPPRRRKKKGKGGGRCLRGMPLSAGENTNLELLLQHKLNELEVALQRQEEVD